MSEKNDDLRLSDIVDQIDYLIAALSKTSFEQFSADRTLYQSVAFSLQVIGEAANNLSDVTKAKAPEVPWPKIVALRNRIVHGYFSLELTEIWRIATVDAPRLRAQLSDAGLGSPPA